MVRSVPPQILVIVDRPDTDWKPRLKAIDVALSIVEPFRDAKATNVLLRVNGETPDLPGNVLSRLSRWQIRRLWSIQSPASLPPFDTDGTLEVLVDNQPSRWKRTVIGSGVMVAAVGGDPLQGWKGVDLIQHEDGSLSIQPVIPE
jgi:hypothetical protein